MAGITLASIVTLSSIGLTMNKSEISTEAKSVQKEPTNIIMIVMDGTSENLITLSRWYKGDSLTMDSILIDAVRTYSAESAITDSAPAATAFSSFCICVSFHLFLSIYGTDRLSQQVPL